MALAVTPALLVCPALATAAILPPTTVDGPSAEILDLGGAAMAPDGSGGVVYTKSVAGVPHVFASRCTARGCGAPIRVDWDQPYEGGQPAIAAGDGGRLLVVWVTGVATVQGQVRYGLFSAALGAGGAGFGPSLLVDPNLGEGVGVDPSLSGASPGRATVAYRAITYNFNQNGFSTAVQLRPGDVMADIRIARLNTDRWSRIGAVNRNPEASMRPPGPTNGPQVSAGINGNAVIAWQEPDQTGTARIWLRRVFGTTLGPVLEVSPPTWEGKPVSGDADAFALGGTPSNEARVAFRVAGSRSREARLMLNTLPPDYALTAGQMDGAVSIQTGPQGGLGPAAVAASESGGGPEGTMSLGFVLGRRVRLLGAETSGVPGPAAEPAGPEAEPAPTPVVALDSRGGRTVAYSARDPRLGQVLAVSQEFVSSASQLGLLSGAGGGPVDQLEAGLSGTGDALIGFRQGPVGGREIVVARVSAPPASFVLSTPKGWVRPGKAKLRWRPAGSAVGGVTYSVLLDGHVVKKGLLRRAFLPPRGQLPSGALRAQVMAVDGLGQQVLSPVKKLRVDGLPPRVSVHERPSRGAVSVRVRDDGAGLKSGSSLVAFGDGDRMRGASSFHHLYARGGAYTISVRAHDRLGNRVSRHFRVVVR